jgi:hypothetical protein
MASQAVCSGPSARLLNHRKNGLLALLYTVLATAVIDPHWNSFSALHLVAAANVSCNGPGRDAIAD